MEWAGLVSMFFGVGLKKTGNLLRLAKALKTTNGEGLSGSVEHFSVI